MLRLRFTPATDAFAHCMMGLAQQRDAQDAADRRQNALNATIAEQAQRDRDAQAARDAASRPVSAPPSFPSAPSFPSMGIPAIPTPANMTCTSSSTTTGNAGTMTQNCHQLIGYGG